MSRFSDLMIRLGILATDEESAVYDRLDREQDVIDAAAARIRARTAEAPRVQLLLPHRCTYCDRWIWPWSRIGWRVLTWSVQYWHPPCRALYERFGHFDWQSR